MHLSPEDIAAAEACGVSFFPASDAQVQRLAMQRKVFYRAGEPVLATRGDGFFETAGTLQQLIEGNRRQQRDLTQWLQATPAAAETQDTEGVAAPVETGMGGTVQAPQSEAAVPVDARPAALELEAVPPKRPRQRRRLAVAEPGGGPGSTEVQEPEPVATVPLPSDKPRSPERGKRWLVAGALRRGRAGKHWSTRHR